MITWTQTANWLHKAYLGYRQGNLTAVVKVPLVFLCSAYIISDLGN
jgi:hypothetical protein